MVSVVVLLVSSVLVGITPVGGVIKGKICEALDATCSTPEIEQRANELPSCVVRKDVRTLGYGGHIRFFNADRTDGDNLTVNADGSATFSTSQGSAAGVGVSGKKVTTGSATLNGLDPSVDARAQLKGDATYVYNVPEEWGGAEVARDLRNSRNSTLNRYGRLVVGPVATSLEEGGRRLVNGAKGAVRGLKGLLFDDHESAEEKQRREQQESLGEADAIKVTLGLQGSASGSIDADLVEASAGGKLEVRGEVTIPLNTQGPDAADASFTAAFDLEGQIAAVLGVPGDGRPGQQPTADIPPFLELALGGGRQWSYTVDYDRDGNPAKVTFETESRSGFGMGIDGTVKKGGASASGNAGAKHQEVQVDQTILDLTVPENREAFDDLFMTYGVGVGDHQARVSQISLLATPGEFLARAQTLQDRITTDGFNVRYVYEGSGSGLSAGGNSQRDGIDFAVAGVSWEDSSATLQLVEATAHDFRAGGIEVPLASGCAR